MAAAQPEPIQAETDTPLAPVQRMRAKSLVDEDGVHHEYEFGGPPGVVGMMVFFPCLFYYLYICLTLNDGQSTTLPGPARLPCQQRAT